MPATVFYLSEDGRLCSVNVAVPFSLSAEDTAIAEGACAVAEMKLLNLEARTLNPRKIMVRGELEAKISVYEHGMFALTEGLTDCGHIHPHITGREISLVRSVTEKSFALADELPLPPAAEGVNEVILAGCECVADESKTVGSKLILKGRVKSSLLMINGEGELCRLEPITEFSQIVELGAEVENGLCAVALIPSGAYAQVNPEGMGRVGLEYHIVAQVTAQSSCVFECMDNAYSNSYPIECMCEEKEGEYVCCAATLRESLRHLFESSSPVTEVLYCGCSIGEALFEGERMSLPLVINAVCKGADGLHSEKRRAEVQFRLPPMEGTPWLRSVELCSCVLLPVPGGLELRAEVCAEVCETRALILRCVSSIEYDEDCPLDNSEKPPLVLLKPGAGTDLWQIARDNCSSEEAILSANGLESAAEAQGKLILVPKIC